MPSNRAAYQPFKNAPRLEVSAAPYPSAAENQVIIKNAAVAINIIDSIIQRRGNMAFTHLKYPFVLGSDMAGEIVEVGKGVNRLHVGDRVLGLSRASDASINDPAQGGFQLYSVLNEDVVSPIPASMTFEQAAALPLGLATATAALFDATQLDLDLPEVPMRKSTGKAVIIWGGSTSVGCNAVQLAAAAGYEVFSTSSPKNFGYLRKLGATRVWDYRSRTVVNDIVAALKGKVVAGAVSIGGGAAEKCMEIVDKCSGNKYVAMVTYPMPDSEPQSLVMMRTVAHFASWMIWFRVKGAIKGIKGNLVVIAPIFENGIGRHVFADFLPKALESGSFVAAPEPHVIGSGLEQVQHAFDLVRQGVSVKKVEVIL